MRSKILTSRLPLIVFFLLFYALTFAQDQQRIEFEARYQADKFDNFQLVPLKKQGFVLFRETPKQKGKWIFTIYDTCLNKISEKDIQVHPKFVFQAKQKDGENIYLLFTKYQKTEFHIVQFNTTTHQLSLHTIQSLKKFGFTGFRVMKNFFFVSGFVGQNSLVLHFDLISKRTRVLPASLTKDLEIDSIEKDSINDAMHFTIASEKRTDHDLLIKSFDIGGNIINEIKVGNTHTNKLISGKLSILENGKKIVVGTYSDGSSSLADGIYIAGFQIDNTQEYIQFYPFTKFSRFFDFIPEDLQKRISKSKKKNNTLKGKDVRLQYRLLVHNPIRRLEDFLLIAEAYFPLYRYNPKVDWQGRREGVTSEIVFDSYQHTHALAISFNEKGKLLWDNVFQIEPVKNKELQKIIQVRVRKDSLVLLYGVEGFIKSKTIENQSIRESENKVKIPISSKDDHIKRTYSNEIAFWYEKHFLAWGYQAIDNEEDPANPKRRRVFYIAKVKY
ncbi:MAG: hypothetical protein MUE81_16090 [Thermoflexibacter sp.]|jgi:hypothetical protein|nr:hypothetical protein [Thermoflexibacter sp.]